MYVRKTNNMHTLFPLFVSVVLPSTCFEHVHHKEVTSVHAAYSIFHAEIVLKNYVNYLYIRTYSMVQSPS